MADIRVRKARLEDLPSLQQTKRVLSTVLLVRLGHTLEEISTWHEKFCSYKYFLDRLEAPHSLYVLEENCEVRGLASLTLGDDGRSARGPKVDPHAISLEPGATYAYFGNLYVAEPGRGWGSSLMTHRLGAIEDRGVDYAVCHVHSKNEKAQRFVQHFGFKNLGCFHESSLGSSHAVFGKKNYL